MTDAADEYVLDRLAECGLPDRFYAWVDALDPDARGLARDAGDGYTLTGEDMSAGWEAAGLTASGSGKARRGSLVHGSLTLSSTLHSARGSNQLDVTVNLTHGDDLLGGPIAGLAADLCTRQGRQLPDPPYPRPDALSSTDVTWYAIRVAELLRDLARACDVAGPPPPRNRDDLDPDDR